MKEQKEPSLVWLIVGILVVLILLWFVSGCAIHTPGTRYGTPTTKDMSGYHPYQGKPTKVKKQ